MTNTEREIQIGDMVITKTNRKPRIVAGFSEIEGLGTMVHHKAFKDGKAYGKATVTMLEDIIAL